MGCAQSFDRASKDDELNAIFVNPTNPVCGVHAYGVNLFHNLEGSTRCRWTYLEPENIGALRAAASMPSPDAVVYNYSSLIGSFLSEAPFSWINCPQAFVFHDAEVNERFDAIFFSDPTFTPYGKWHVLGRPLPKAPSLIVPDRTKLPTFGVHGFLGAWADQLVHRVTQEFENANIRLLLPYARYGDANGDAARAMADRCRSMVNNSAITLEISHDFLPQPQLLEWLASNDMNVYIRPPEMQWRGVSSATDSALAVNRPIAINKSSAFRHLHSLSPSICVEDSSLTEIFSNGLSPLVAFKAKWCEPEVIREQVESVLMKL